MASTPCISPSQRRALSNPTSLPPLAFIPPNLQELPKDQHALKLYRQMLSKARIPRKHLEYIQDLSRSEHSAIPTGYYSPASHGIYDSLVQCRTFDWFGRPVRDSDINESTCNVFFFQERRMWKMCAQI